MNAVNFFAEPDSQVGYIVGNNRMLDHSVSVW